MPLPIGGKAYYPERVRRDYDKSVFMAYPNPVTSFLNIKSDVNIQKIDIYNITGQSISTVINTDSIDLSGVNSLEYDQVNIPVR